MKNKSIILLRSLMSLSLILIGVGIWLYMSGSKKEEKPKETEETEEILDINSDLVQNLPYPDMKVDCYLVENMTRYSKGFTSNEIEISEKMDTAFRKLSKDVTNTVPASVIQKYVQTYWGNVDNYHDFSFTGAGMIYTYNEEEKTYQIEILATNTIDVCPVGGYEKHFIPVLTSAIRKGDEIIANYVLLYYIEDINDDGTIYHLYQDSSFTRYIETISGDKNDLINTALKNQSTLERYQFQFLEEGTEYHFKESKKLNEINALSELEESQVETVTPLVTNDLCIDFTETHMYSKEHFTPTDLTEKERFFLAFYHAYQNDQLQKEPTITRNQKEYIFTKEEVQAIVKQYWQNEEEVIDFEYFGYKGSMLENGYQLIIMEENQVCANTRKYVETKLDHIYQDGEYLYFDYKIRFMDRQGNLTQIYQDRNYQNILQNDVRSNDVSNDYWDLNYVTYRYVYKKQENGNFYFLEGFYI